MYRNIRKEKGITLIALVVTIIVLLILAGISIRLAVGNNGIIEKAKEATVMYNEAEQNEESVLSEYGDFLLEHSQEFENLDEIEITKSNQNLVRIS